MLNEKCFCSITNNGLFSIFNICRRLMWWNHTEKAVQVKWRWRWMNESEQYKMNNNTPIVYLYLYLYVYIMGEIKKKNHVMIWQYAVCRFYFLHIAFDNWWKAHRRHARAGFVKVQTLTTNQIMSIWICTFRCTEIYIVGVCYRNEIISMLDWRMVHMALNGMHFKSDSVILSLNVCVCLCVYVRGHKNVCMTKGNQHSNGK